MHCLCLFLLLAAGIVSKAAADIPVNCTVEDVLGEWIFYEEKVTTNKNIDCDRKLDHYRKSKITLYDNGVAVEDDWITGHWTMVYNEGMEITIGFRSYFAYFKYRQENDVIISYCNTTVNGKAHDVTLRNYGCFFGKQTVHKQPKYHLNPFHQHHLLNSEKLEKNHFVNLVEEINSKQTSWEATVYDKFVNMTFEELQNIAGGRGSWLPGRPTAYPTQTMSVSATDSWDWRNVTGKNYVSPVRDQGSCGSCYAFSSTGMVESRLRVFSNNKLQPVLSPQDIVSCTTLAQGCSGGFPFLIAGRYGWETGLADESCYPYNGKDGTCSRNTCSRWYTAKYSYVGGFFGGCNEMAMMEAVKTGPISVSFEVNPDFMAYKSGIYRHTNSIGNSHLFKSFVPVNHAVLLVGYGYDAPSGEKYWIVKNSWGESWGENGFFRILRGVDEVGIESIAVQAFPIPEY